MPKSWFEFKNADETEAEVSIYDAIGYYGVSARSFIEALKKVEGKKLTVRINSPGGVVTEGLAIFNALKRHKAGVTVQIDSIAASMATYIALAGATVRMAENAYFMIHNVSGGAYGTAKDMRKAADVCEKLQKGIVAVYVAKTGKTEEEVEEKMDEETWFGAEEAKEFGFIDEVTDPIEADACMGEEGREMLAKFRHLPAALRVDTHAGSHRKPAESHRKPPMKIVSVQIAALLATFTGGKFTEDSTEAEVKAALDGFTGKLTALQGEKATLTAELATANGKVTNLETEVANLKGTSQTASQKAQEIAAAHGSAGATKTPEEAQGNGAKSGKDIFAAYSKLNGLAAAKFWKDNEKDLLAFMESETERERRRREED